MVNPSTYTHAVALLASAIVVVLAGYVLNEPVVFWLAWCSACLLATLLLVRDWASAGDRAGREQERTAAVIGALYMGAHYAEDIHRRAGGGSLFLTTEALNHLEDRGAIEVVDENGGDGRRGYYLVRGYVHTMPRGR